MSEIKITNEGEKVLIVSLLNQPLTLHLIKNNLTVTDTITFDGTNIVENDFLGYSSVNLDATNWQAPTTNGEGHAQSDYNTQVSWDHTGTTQNCYGYFVQTDDGTASQLIWLEKFDEVQTLQNGNQFAFTPSFEFWSGDST